MLGHTTPSNDLPEQFQQQLKAFNARRKLKRGGLMVLAANRFKNILK